MTKAVTGWAVVAVVATALLGVLLMTGAVWLPNWLLWAMFIASGNLVSTKVTHNGETEQITLVMTFILIAIQSLGWPEIAVATVIGVGLGELWQKRPWYKKLYNTVAISIAGVITEILFTYSNFVPFETIMGSALVFDAVLYTLLVPIWLYVAKQTLLEIHESYWLTFYTVPLSAMLAWASLQAISLWGSAGIIAVTLTFFVLIKSHYVIGDQWLINELCPNRCGHVHV